MEELATYTGYAVIILLSTAVILFCLFTLYSIITSIYRICYRRKTTYKAAFAALEYLHKVGCEETQTLKDVRLMIEDFKKRYEMEEEQ